MTESQTPQLSRSRHVWMRTGYFVATAFFGFLLGAGFLAMALCLGNVALPKDGTTTCLLAAGAVLAAVGGLLASKSYREMRNR